MEKYRTIMAAMLVAALLLVSCEEKTALKPEFKLASETEITVPAEGGKFSIAYNIENPAEEGDVTATTEQSDWITGLNTETSDMIYFDVAANEAQEGREGRISIAYKYSGNTQSVNVAILQEGTTVVTPPDYSDAFTIEVGETTASTANITATCKYPELFWTTDVITKADYDLHIAGNESAMQSYFMNVLQSIALNYGYTSVSDFLPTYLFAGDYKYDEVKADLMPETEYMTFAIGMDYKMNFTTKFYYGPEFATADLLKSNLTFEFEVEAMETSATISVYPSDKEAYYYTTVIDSSYFGAGLSDKEIMMDLIDDYGDNLIYNLYQGDLIDAESSGMFPTTYYYAVAFGVDPDTGFYNTELFKHEFQTVQSKVSDAYAEGSMDNYWLISDLINHNPDYSSLIGSEDLLAAFDIEFNDLAVSAICAVFVGDLSDVDQFELYRTTLVQGTPVNKGDAARLVYMSYNDPCSLCVIGKDAEGYNGEMSLTVVDLTEDGTSHDYALFDEYYNDFFGSSGSSVKAMSPTMLITK